jgi:hypothetical protein
MVELCRKLNKRMGVLSFWEEGKWHRLWKVGGRRWAESKDCVVRR